MATIWQTRDRLGQEVVLTDTGWFHILEERKRVDLDPDMVRLAIEQADRVNRDAQRPHRLVHYRDIGPGTLMIKVAVRYWPVPPDGSWAGEVATAYRTHRVPSKETRLWP